VKITLETAESVTMKKAFRHDRDGDSHYDVLSAFQKSIRGSDVNASLHYLGRMLKAEDLESIFRRLTVICYEDIGLANPSMGPKVDAAINAALRLGFPECRIPLSAIVIEMALSPKSNSAEIAIDMALNDVRSGNIGDVPKHLKNPSSDYKYPHNYKNDYVKQQYLPDKLINVTYYHPKENKNEKVLRDIMNKLDEFK
jgi:putative ATPase